MEEVTQMRKTTSSCGVNDALHIFMPLYDNSATVWNGRVAATACVRIK